MRPNPSDPERTASVAIVATRVAPVRPSDPCSSSTGSSRGSPPRSDRSAARRSVRWTCTSPSACPRPRLRRKRPASLRLRRRRSSPRTWRPSRSSWPARRSLRPTRASRPSCASCSYRPARPRATRTGGARLARLAAERGLHPVADLSISVADEENGSAYGIEHEAHLVARRGSRRFQQGVSLENLRELAARTHHESMSGRTWPRSSARTRPPPRRSRS
jgi:hypothetical protein